MGVAVLTEELVEDVNGGVGSLPGDKRAIDFVVRGCFTATVTKDHELTVHGLRCHHPIGLGVLLEFFCRLNDDGSSDCSDQGSVQ